MPAKAVIRLRPTRFSNAIHSIRLKRNSTRSAFSPNSTNGTRPKLPARVLNRYVTGISAFLCCKLPNPGSASWRLRFRASNVAVSDSQRVFGAETRSRFPV
jgi:hypothetical protein